MFTIPKEPDAADILFPYFVGKEVLGGITKPKRFLLDFGQLDQLAAKAYPKALHIVENKILPARVAAAKKGTAEGEDARSHHEQFLGKWWQLSYRRTEMLEALAMLKRYIVCSRVTSRPIFLFINAKVRPGDAFQVFAFEDDYSFGILQSSLHVEWFMSKRSNMKSDPRYSSEGVFGTFPWPQNPDPIKVAKVAECSVTLQKLRTSSLTTAKGGLRAIYDTLSKPGKNPLKDAHAALDAAVLAAYGFSTSKDLLQQTLELNASVAANLNVGNIVLGPGIPTSFKSASTLVSNDCIGD